MQDLKEEKTVLLIKPDMQDLKEEKTVLLIKPDGVKRGLIGEIISRVEKRGLKVIALNMIWATKEQIDGHYPKDEKWIIRLGDKTKETYEKYGFDTKKELGTTDSKKIGEMVRSWLIDFMTSGPLVKMIVKGVHAIDMDNIVHASESPKEAEHEINFWFSPEEIHDYKRAEDDIMF